MMSRTDHRLWASQRRTIVALCCIAAMAGCATMGTRPNTLVPTRHTLDAGPYRISTNAPLDADAPAVRSLVALERQMRHTLMLPSSADSEPIEVYILDDRATFNHFLKFYYPELPPRRAFFFAQGTRRVVYTYEGDQLDVDLRHEATHALLHGAISDLPLWLDEGLAEYFETVGAPPGLNREHLQHLVQDEREGWSPDLARLETLTDVRQMNPRDYREAWAWVHYLLDSGEEHRAVLLEYLADLRAESAPAPLSARMEGEPSRAGDALRVHLGALRPSGMAKATKDATKLRAQDAALGTTPSTRVASQPRAQKGFFERAAGVLTFPAKAIAGWLQR